jgi:hypothetical protein
MEEIFSIYNTTSKINTIVYATGQFVSTRPIQVTVSDPSFAVTTPCPLPNNTPPSFSTAVYVPTLVDGIPRKVPSITKEVSVVGTSTTPRTH